MNPGMTRGKCRGRGGRGGRAGRGSSAPPVTMPTVPSPTFCPQQGGMSSSDVPNQINQVPNQINQVQASSPSSVPPVQTSHHSGTATTRSKPTPTPPNQTNTIGEGTSTQSNTTGEGDSRSSRMQRTLLYLTPTGLEPQRRCSEVIFASFKHELDPRGINWKSLSPETINMYFGEFKKQFYWDSSIDGVVRSLWERRAADRYRDFISKRKSVGIRPHYVKSEIWDNWMELWKDPKSVEKSETTSRNRCGSGNGLAVGTHTGGSVSIGEYRKRLVLQLIK